MHLVLRREDGKLRYVDVWKDKASCDAAFETRIHPAVFAALAESGFAKRLDQAGADGLVLFNRFYQPDFDLERREVAMTTSALLQRGPGHLRTPSTARARGSSRMRPSRRSAGR